MSTVPLILISTLLCLSFHILYLQEIQFSTDFSLVNVPWKSWVLVSAWDISHPYASCQWIRKSPSLMILGSAARPQAQIHCPHTVPAVLGMQWLPSMARFLSSLKQRLLLWWDENMLPLCLNVFQQSLVRCLGTMSSKYTHTYYSSGNTHTASVTGTEVISLPALP